MSHNSIPARPRLSIAMGALAATLLLAACGESKEEAAPGAESDPALTGALGDQIMVDPDLAAQNRGNAAISGGGPASAEIPPEKATPEAAAAARAEAAAISGGKLAAAPAAVAGAEAAQSAATAEKVAAGAMPGGAGNCAAKVEYTTAWATRTPAPFPVYPRAHVTEAAGTDKDGFKLRVINFVTPVSIDDVMSFYATRARMAGFAAGHAKTGSDNVLSGTKANSAYVVYARSKGNGLTEVDLVTNGG